MLTIYSGTVGSGKSFRALEVGLKVIKEKRHGQYRHVIANFPLIPKEEVTTRFMSQKRKDKINERNAELDERWIFSPELSVEYLIAKSIEMGWYEKEGMCMVIIDEAGIAFNTRDWQRHGDIRAKWIKFFSLSRKFGYDFILVAQSDRMIDRQIRDLCEYEVRNMKGNNSFFLSWVTLIGITLFMRVHSWREANLRGKLRFGIFKKRIAERYDTMRVFDFDDLIDSIKKMYEGKIVPAAVYAQIGMWEDEKIKRALELREEEEKLLAAGGHQFETIEGSA